jgi:serine/threonine protein kinase
MAIFDKSGSQASQHNSSVPPRKAPFKKGDFIGQKYEVFDVLGEGGFGIVYLVYLNQTKSAYALKTFRDEYIEDIKTRERFRKEAQVWIDLERHPYLVRASFVDEISGRLYIAMEHIASDEPGMNTLDGFLRRSPPDLAQSLRWAIQFCHGMEYACSKGVKAHRDIKPANIMIDQNKSVKITDFGLARVFVESSFSEQGHVAGEVGNDSSIQTAIGTSIGTPEYMPPEQFTDLTVCDERSDIYSFA